MTIKVELGAMEQVVERLVQSGRFASVEDVLLEGVRLVNQRELDVQTLSDDLDAGIVSLETEPLISSDVVFDELKKRYQSIISVKQG